MLSWRKSWNKSCRDIGSCRLGSEARHDDQAAYEGALKSASFECGSGVSSSDIERIELRSWKSDNSWSIRTQS